MNPNNNESATFVNHLIIEKSPYLLQHALDPIEWYSWSFEAIARAKHESKPIFLHIGYSTCHFCHIISKDFFKDEDTVQLMNKNYINILVDRDETPEIDTIYSQFSLIETRILRWPLTIYLTPELRPFYIISYTWKDYKNWKDFRYELMEVLLENSDTWKKGPVDFINESEYNMNQLERIVQSYGVSSGYPIPGESMFEASLLKHSRMYTTAFGGFSGPPKVLPSSIIKLMFHYYARDKKNYFGYKCLNMCLKTLNKLAYGGVHDHVSGGFARCSKDDDWHVPHFTKLLSDQALLLMVYTTAYKVTKRILYRKVIESTVEYVNRDLRHPLGGYYNSEGADSYPFVGAPHTQEGAYYVWEYEEIASLIGKKRCNQISYLDIFCDYFSVERNGNVAPECDPHGFLENKNVLTIIESKRHAIFKYGICTDRFDKIIKQCLSLLSDARAKRPRPYLDTKILCSWNGLIISGLAQAGQGLRKNSFIRDAVSAANFIRDHLYDANSNTLTHTCYVKKDGTIMKM